jgi:hypothetical protein
MKKIENQKSSNQICKQYNIYSIIVAQNFLNAVADTIDTF